MAEDLGVKIVSKDVAFWDNQKKHSEQTIVDAKNSIILHTKIKELADEMILTLTDLETTKESK